MPRPLMLFAAGFGTRMRHLTADRPKPLIEVAGRALLDHALDLAAGAGAAPIVVNTHYRGAQIAAHLAGRDLHIRHEEVILETGGGLRAARPLLGAGPVFTLNTDAVWTGPNPLTCLDAAWMQGTGALLGLVPAAQARGYRGAGDFGLDGQGRLIRGGPFVYTGAQIVDPAGLEDIPEAAFSLNRHWDRLIAQGRARGLVLPCGWCDVGYPEAIPLAEAVLREGPGLREGSGLREGAGLHEGAGDG
ncbi:nucleotidyltransferase family protein [Phaeovulum vinaykumarii]|uniref:MurNAc alpha-1-phosphate uridylyltransferase n=1 Tax=Phaeovulum vinaykumarii TaxID=407234 RepID=A0A1N7K9A9_9RHOB|nr:nucleotidyltransferase family protein [Phaeovulum vinaykumarii]SIS58165.1 MurNAc alpha-1-phosphate uridylyltransferase [Phaeovulum vinaykumarii]SOB93702.1 MurNAc alpha-1-phosphate uridylyltransferase [Phaeovulum vinaykumarii]